MDIQIEKPNNNDNKEKEKEKEEENNLEEIKIKDDEKEEVIDIKDSNDNNIIIKEEIFNINENWTYKTFSSLSLCDMILGKEGWHVVVG